MVRCALGQISAKTDALLTGLRTAFIPISFLLLSGRMETQATRMESGKWFVSLLSRPEF